MQNEELTPMLLQYHSLKREYEDCLLFFRLGDFYELFYEDAIIGSRELGIVLTSRPVGKGKEKIPMCGVPYHSFSSYVSRLVSRGYKVAICEQLEDSSQAKGLVKRDVVRVITPGTYFEKEEHSGLASIYKLKDRYYCAYLNPYTGEFFGFCGDKKQVEEFMLKLSPKEVLTPKGLSIDLNLKAYITSIPEEDFIEGKKVILEKWQAYHHKAFGFEDEGCLYACGGVYIYLKRTQKNFLPYVQRPKPYRMQTYLRIDHRARVGLELTESYEGHKEHSLFGILDRTITPMGRRLLKFNILHPYSSLDAILKVQDAVEELIQKRHVLKTLRELLDGIHDLEKLVSRISGNMATPRDLVHLKKALYSVYQIKDLVDRELSSEFFKELYFADTLHLAQEIDRVLVDDPPLHVKEGGLIKDGVSKELDELKSVRDNSESILKEYEEELRTLTGIGSLKIGYNKVMGYYIEVTKPNLKFVPSYFKRRQTLSNAERFTTDKLIELEEKIMASQKKIELIEYELYSQLKAHILSYIEDIAKNAKAIAQLDYVQSLATIAIEKDWTKPKMVEEKVIHVEGGRHPVIESFVRDYVPNDTHMDEESFMMVITGPNMAGKSSYIRQVALITILAHMGSFVPAKSATIGLVSSVHTRIGSGDMLALGVSTFMNEMLDVASMLNTADERSLLILDELGRGTSTYDGIAISKAILEYIHDKLKARTLVATHYTELTELEGKLKGLKNYHMAAIQEDKDVRFLYVLKRGPSNGSLGVYIAQMAGLPEEIVSKAHQYYSMLATKSEVPTLEEVYQKSIQMEQVEKLQRIAEKLKSVDVANLTPLQALLLLAQLKEELLIDKEHYLL